MRLSGLGTPLGVARGETAFAGLNPELQKVQGLGSARIELAVGHAAAGAHELDLAGLEHTAISEAVFVLQLAFQNIAEDFHVSMRMRPETLTPSDPVVVDHTQRAKAHVRRIVIIGEGKGVVGIQPTVVSVVSFIRPPDFQTRFNRFHGKNMAVVRPFG